MPAALHAIITTTAATDVAAVIVYGPQGCGKTRYGQAIANHFGKTHIIDDWKLGDHLPQDALCLTNDERVHGLQEFQMPGLPPSAVFEFVDVMAAIDGQERAA
jgi:hypothetical protein